MYLMHNYLKKRRIKYMNLMHHCLKKRQIKQFWDSEIILIMSVFSNTSRFVQECPSFIKKILTMKKVINSSLDFNPTPANWIKSILKFVLSSQRWLMPKVSTIINLIPLRLWQSKVEFEDGLINFKILFLKAEKISEFIFNSKLFHSMTVDYLFIYLLKLYLPLVHKNSFR